MPVVTLDDFEPDVLPRPAFDFCSWGGREQGWGGFGGKARAGRAWGQGRLCFRRAGRDAGRLFRRATGVDDCTTDGTFGAADDRAADSCAGSALPGADFATDGALGTADGRAADGCAGSAFAGSRRCAALRGREQVLRLWERPAQGGFWGQGHNHTHTHTQRKESVKTTQQGRDKARAQGGLWGQATATQNKIKREIHTHARGRK